MPAGSTASQRRAWTGFLRLASFQNLLGLLISDSQIFRPVGISDRIIHTRFLERSEPQGAAVADAACGVCDSCALRLRAFQEAGMDDPIAYANRPEYLRI